MDAPGVGLQAPEAGEHQDSEEESQHGEAQSGVCDQGQRLQIPLQLLLIEVEKGEKGGEVIERKYYWIHNILVEVDEKDRGKEGSSRRERKCESGKV